MRGKMIHYFCFYLVFSSSTVLNAYDLLVSGITTPGDAEGIYNQQPGTMFGWNHWKHESENYYIYKDEWNGSDYWNIDDNYSDDDGMLFYSGSPTDDSPLDETWGWLNGTGSPNVVEYTAYPEIEIQGNGNVINDGDNTPVFNDHTHFGTLNVSSGTLSRTYTINNLGAGTLNLTGSSPYVVISGTHTADFSVTSIPSGSIASLGNTSFQVTFDPSGTGDRTATVSVANNDSDENPYNFDIIGYGATNKNLVVSGITNPEAANGTYINQGLVNNFEYWKHETLIYYLYNDDWNGTRYYNIDVDIVDDDNDYLFQSASESGTPAGLGGWIFNPSVGSSGTVSVAEATLSAPTVSTNAASNITTNSATLNGTVNANNASTTATFEYGLTTAYGTTVTADESPVTGSADTPVSKGISGLSQGVTYHYRAVGVNSQETTYGSDQAFTTITTPACTTSAASSVTTTSAELGGNITDSGGASVTERGVVYSSSDTSPTIGEPGVIQDTNGSGTGTFSEPIGGLSSGTVYWFRAYAVNSVGTSYGDAERCTTLVDITFRHGADGTLDFHQSNASPPESDWLCGQFSLYCDRWGATLNSVTLTLSGTYDPGDLEPTPFQLYTSTTNDFATSGTLGPAQADPGSGSNLTFSAFSHSVSSSGYSYYWVTADIAASATADDKMSATIDASGDLSISGGALNGSSKYGKLNAGINASLPVELSSFAARFVNEGVLIQWATESEINNLGFILESKNDKTGWIEVASYMSQPNLRGRGNTSSRTNYEFLHATVQSGDTCQYRLSNVNMDGNTALLDQLEIMMENQTPDKTSLLPPFPNPFNPITKISYKLAEISNVTLTVYDINGRLVYRILKNVQQSPGHYSYHWLCKDDQGRQAASGTYILHLIAGDVVQSKKVILIR